MGAANMEWLWVWVILNVLALVWLVDSVYRWLLARRGLAGPRRVPHREMDTWRKTAMDAVVLARAGKTVDGYERLLAGRRRALELTSTGVPWADELVKYYQAVLNDYISRFGTGERGRQCRL